METRDMNLELYVAPEVELLEVQVEVGFAGSETGTDPGFGGGDGTDGFPG